MKSSSRSSTSSSTMSAPASLRSRTRIGPAPTQARASAGNPLAHGHTRSRHDGPAADFGIRGIAKSRRCASSGAGQPDSLAALRSSAQGASFAAAAWSDAGEPCGDSRAPAPSGSKEIAEVTCLAQRVPSERSYRKTPHLRGFPVAGL